MQAMLASAALQMDTEKRLSQRHAEFSELRADEWVSSLQPWVKALLQGIRDDDALARFLREDFYQRPADLHNSPRQRKGSARH